MKPEFLVKRNDGTTEQKMQVYDNFILLLDKAVIVDNMNLITTGSIDTCISSRKKLLG